VYWITKEEKMRGIEHNKRTLANTISIPDFGTPPSLAFCNAAAKRGLAFGSGESGGFIDWWIS